MGSGRNRWLYRNKGDQSEFFPYDPCDSCDSCDSCDRNYFYDLPYYRFPDVFLLAEGLLALIVISRHRS